LLVGGDGSYQNTLNQLFGGAQGQSNDSPSHLAAAAMCIMSALQTNLDGKSELYQKPRMFWGMIGFKGNGVLCSNMLMHVSGLLGRR